jgi:hypothetical protein
MPIGWDSKCVCIEHDTGGRVYPLHHILIIVQPETHTKRQATQHGSLSSLLGDGDKGIEIVNGEEKSFCTGRLEQLRMNKNLLYLHNKPNEPTKEENLKFFNKHAKNKKIFAI